MANVLVLYATTHGHTAKIAARIGDALQAEHVRADVREVSEAGEAAPLDYDGAILCASLHQGRHQPEMVDWARHHHIALAERPSAFVSVSLTAAEDSEEARQATRDCIDDFLDDTGWTPQRTLPVAGALEYREYDVFTRTLMRLMMKRGGHPTDISHDHDYTDWDLVARFGREFAALVRPRREP
jgi:menaquinone-dependent protoporphyrinogen oxidase